MLGRTASSIKNLPQADEGGYEAALQAQQQAQIAYVRQVGFDEGMTSGEVEAFVHMAQRAGQEQERTMAGMLDPQALAISNAASDVALRLLRDEIRESGLFSGLGEFDIGSLISSAIGAASQIAVAKIGQATTKSTIKASQQLEQMRLLQEQKQAELTAAMASGVSSSGGLTSSLAKPIVWVPVALAGGALVLFLMLRK